MAPRYALHEVARPAYDFDRHSKRSSVARARAHLTRYFGVFAPAFAARAGIVPAGAGKAPHARPGADSLDPEAPPAYPRRFPWA